MQNGGYSLYGNDPETPSNPAEPSNPSEDTSAAGVWNTVGNYASGVGEIVKGVSTAGQFALNLQQLISGDFGRERDPYYRTWIKASEERRRQAENLLFAPWAQGAKIPYLNESESTWGSTGLSPEYQNIYSGFMSREYGVPQDITQSAIAQSIAGAGSGAQGTANAQNPMQAYASMQSAPGGIAQALGRIQQTGYAQQQNYLRNAAEIATYNAMRTKQLRSIVG